MKNKLQYRVKKTHIKRTDTKKYQFECSLQVEEHLCRYSFSLPESSSIPDSTLVGVVLIEHIGLLEAGSFGMSHNSSLNKHVNL